MSEHTPGPWEYEWSAEYDSFFVFDDKGFTIAEILRNEANARLIAAAPELYEALKEMCDYWGAPPADQWSYDSRREDGWKKAQAALALVDKEST